MSENLFLCGIDFGKECISISYFSYSSGEPEIIDVSGGYATASLSACVTYVPDYDEWITGEYALKETSENAVFFKNITENVGKDMFYTCCEKRISNGQLLEMLISEIISQIKNVNPNCILRKITVTRADGFNNAAKREYIAAFEKNGVSSDRLIFESNVRCALRYYNGNSDKICIMDMGCDELRIFSGKKGFKTKVIGHISSRKAYNRVYECFARYLKQERSVLSTAEMKAFDIFADEHKNIALKNNLGEYVNLYYSFCYPPFKKKIPSGELNGISGQLIDDLCNVVNDFSQDYEFILSGGIFEQADFRNSFIKKSGIKCVNKAFKAVFSMGGALFSAESCGVIGKSTVLTEEENRLDFDIGIMTDKFIPIIECDSFVSEKFYAKCLILPNSTGGSFEIDLYAKKKNGNLEITDTICADGFQSRKKGTVRIKLAVMITENNSLKVEISDMGFGEFYDKTDFLQKYERNDIF